VKPRFEDGLVIVGDEAWFPEKWEAEQRRREAERRSIHHSLALPQPPVAPLALPQPAAPRVVSGEPGTVLVDMSPDTFALFVRGALGRAVSDDFRAFPTEDQARWRALADKLLSRDSKP
jgi:hypothetical protein